MSRSTLRLVAACATSATLLGAAAYACPTAHLLPLGSIVNSATGGCFDPCGPADCGPGSPTPPGTLDSGGIPFDISMVDFTFLPNEPIIKPNTTVRWTNNSPFFQHSTVRPGRWNSGFMNPGKFFDHFFGEADAGMSFDYMCTLHFGMDGTVRVAHFGDANLDGIVNLADFNILAANFGQSGRTWDTGDFNGDGVVNLADFNLLAANFGREVNVGEFDFGSMVVPEPATAALVLSGAALLLRRHRRCARARAGGKHEVGSFRSA